MYMTCVSALTKLHLLHTSASLCPASAPSFCLRSCTISGDTNWYTNVGGPAHPLARGLYDSGSTLHDGPEQHDARRAHATQCGVNIVSPNYLQPRDMAVRGACAELA